MSTETFVYTRHALLCCVKIQIILAYCMRIALMSLTSLPPLLCVGFGAMKADLCSDGVTSIIQNNSIHVVCIW